MNDQKAETIFSVVDGLADAAFEADLAELELEIAENGRTTTDVVSSMRGIFGKARMQLAKASRVATAEQEAEPHNVVDIAPALAIAKLKQIIAANPQISMAARKGTENSEADAVSTLQDMLRLGLISKDDLA